MSEELLKDYLRRRIMSCNQERHWTKKQLSEASGVNVNTISRITARKKCTRLDTVAELCKGYGMTMSEFFEGYKTGEKVNKVILKGELVRDPEIGYSQNEKPVAMTRYTLKVDRPYRKENESSKEFVSCIAFGISAEYAYKYFKKGMKVLVSGRVKTESYENKEGIKIYASGIIVDEQELS